MIFSENRRPLFRIMLWQFRFRACKSAVGAVQDLPITGS